LFEPAPAQAGAKRRSLAIARTEVKDAQPRARQNILVSGTEGPSFT
jgi:hypothetical protein